MKRLAALLLVATLGLACLGSGKRKSSHIISFHTQASADFSSSKRVFEWPPGNGTFFYSKSPVIHQKQIRAFSAFDGDDGGWGAVFRLTTGGRESLRAATSSHGGKYLLAVVQGEPRSIVKLDRYVDDGQIVVWEKLRPDDMELFEKKFSIFE